ncbi:spermidine N(1)-acetyltransferase [Peptococcaceae bacterium CEB3]|nr:spermidine N(1)-acetyltransferase [Peptococcaceae bacterium CEB3]
MEFRIRPVCLGDAKDINELRHMPGVFENILGIPSERLKKTEDWISKLDNYTHEFVAIITDESGSERVVGMAGLTVFGNSRLRHSAGIGIMVHREYQGNGIGRKLMETLLDIADNWLMLVRVELSVFVDNLKAIELYKKLGFDIEGTKRKAAIRNGEYIDEYVMARIRNT